MIKSLHLWQTCTSKEAYKNRKKEMKMTKIEQFRNEEYVVWEIHSESFLVETVVNDKIDDNKDRYFSTLDQAMDFVSSDNI